MPRFKLTVKRTAWGERVVEVEAKDEKAAKDKALEKAGDLEFSTNDATYEVDFIKKVEDE